MAATVARNVWQSRREPWTAGTAVPTHLPSRSIPQPIGPTFGRTHAFVVDAPSKKNRACQRRPLPDSGRVVATTTLIGAEPNTQESTKSFETFAIQRTYRRRVPSHGNLRQGCHESP